MSGNEHRRRQDNLPPGAQHQNTGSTHDPNASANAQQGQGQDTANANRDPGLTGGKATLQDFSDAAGVTQSDVDAAGAAVAANNQKSLAEIQAMLGGTANPVARSEKQVLAAIASGVMPRYVARVGEKSGFDGGSFGYSGANQIFATEPADVAGLNAAQALVKVGWTIDQLKGKIGKEIAVCVLDTEAAVKKDDGSEASPTVNGITWADLQRAAMDEKANAWFYTQLGKFEGSLCGRLEKQHLPGLFELAARTPVGAEPDTDNETMKQAYKIFRKAIDRGLSASYLYSGMGATISENGEVGAREVMVNNNGSGFKLEPGKNCFINSLGVLQQTEVDALLAGN